MSIINYKILYDSQSFYQGRGFQPIEVPWTVTKEISDITRPSSAKEFQLKDRDKVLVASAEQSFLYLYNKGFLPKGKYSAITPCFRDEPFGVLHTKYFMKNELINTIEVSQKSLEELVETAMTFFREYIKDPDNLQRQYTTDGIDILYKGYEIGSYGIRQCQFLEWVFGTGAAEPRFSRLIYGLS
jgi:hypothetical protein